ncbi:hypothetical protein [Acidianus ambivalens]|jgi:translation initiation factor 2B subunit (eIF-2B alpha/beta/delta family)|uniref:Uncharacterized protein n=2 Tax=Acidianus TaxID=12914 RepID=A0A650CVQ2_ACIAM|nr:hypothetical protein [Acidianus ambivalens]MQL55645.1 hypothetical protein [Acidianus ambivalens]PVU73995.1 hypothetical protein DDW13_09075 [Acidianus hospitalis]QGR21775.1 hypothetical protein D1866_07000 [Acidianus ambivalens]
MNLVDILLKIQNEKNSLDWEKLKKEYMEQGEIIKSLEVTVSKIHSIKQELRRCSLNEVSEEYLAIKNYLSKAKNSDNPREIISYVNNAYEELKHCLKLSEDIIKEKIQKYKEIIDENNRKLKTYLKIFLTILGESKDLRLFEITDNLEELERNAKESEEEARKIYEELKDKLSKLNIEGKRLEILLSLLDQGQVTITKRNSKDVIELLRFLSEKGIIITVKI